MRFIQEWGFTVKAGKEEEHQRWLLKNEKKLAAAHPKGTKYLGTFGVVFSSDKQAGNYRTLIELDSYAALDRMAAAMKDGKGDFGRLLREASQFGDYDHAAGWSQGLYKAVVDATIFDPQG